MTTTDEVWQPPMTGAVHARNRERVLSAFPALSACMHNGYLGLAQHLDRAPQRFFSRSAFRLYLRFLQDEHRRRPHQLKGILNESVHDLDRALAALAEVSQEPWNDGPVEENEYAFMRVCDQQLHPAYLKLSEGVLHRMLYPITATSRRDRKKSTDNLWKLSSCLQELERTPYADLGAHCHANIRNSIAHGRVSYRQREVVYHDKGGKTTKLANRSVLSLVDDMLDTCHGCAVALKIFYRISSSKDLKHPRQVMLEELQAETEAPWWQVDGCLESDLAGKSQLVVYAKPSSRDCFKVQYMAVYTGVLAEKYAPRFDRYFIALNTPIAWPGWAALDGRLLKAVRMRGATSYDDYKGVLEGDMVFYVPHLKLPRILAKVGTYSASLKIHWLLEVETFKQNLNLLPVLARHAKCHRNAWGAVVRGSVVVDIGNRGDDPCGAIRQARGRIVRAAVRLARQNTQTFEVAKYLPLGYCDIAVFQQDYRIRRLTSFGLGPDLICTIRIRRIGRIKAPDILGSTIEEVGQYRIAWNKAWLESLPDDTPKPGTS